MRLPKVRFNLGLSSLITLAGIFFIIDIFFSAGSLSPVEEKYLAAIKILINIMVVIVWIGLGRILGTIASLICFGFIVLFFLSHGQYGQESYYLLSYIASVLCGYFFYRNITGVKQVNKVDSEKIDEQINLLENDVHVITNEIEHLEKRLERYVDLSDLVEKFSSSLSEDDMIKIITENTYRLFGKSDRILLFRVDTVKQELNLVYSKRFFENQYVRQKKGDIFDRWVFWKRQPLLVENTLKDFRFSLHDEDRMDKNIGSLISAPLTSGEKVIGILRMDSKSPHFYSQEELRTLDIIAGLASVAMENAILYKKVMDLAIKDGLTGLFVHKYFIETLDKEIKRAVKTSGSMCVMLFDIDNFKEYNDKHGHMAGDLVLKHISSILQKSMGGGDTAARYGGEEFGVIIPGKKLDEAVIFANAVRQLVESTPIILRREKTKITISIGLAQFPKDAATAEEILRVADRRLYKAKEKGKNRVCSS